MIRDVPGKFEVVDLEVDDPREDEIQVQLVASGLCHSDDHVVTGDLPVELYPTAGGHEGSGIVTKAGRNAKGIREGDHVVFSVMPSCGHCGGAPRVSRASVISARGSCQANGGTTTAPVSICPTVLRSGR